MRVWATAGYRVDLAKTGEEALEIYSQKSFDVVLMDVSMPGMGGLTALEELIKLDSEAVVLMITAFATFDTAISAWEKGANGVIRKPFQNEQILAFVAKGIKKRRKEEERQTLRQAMVRSVNREGCIGRSEVISCGACVSTPSAPENISFPSRQPGQGFLINSARVLISERARSRIDK